MSMLPDNMKTVFGRDTMRLDIITENLANSQTHGYKATRFSGASFVETLNNRVVASEMHTDFSSGSYINTGRPLDIAIHGEGFFVVRSDDGEFLTRNGSFVVNSAGDLVTSAGFEVMGTNGPVRIPLNENSLNDLIVKDNGEMVIGGRSIATLRCVVPEQQTAIERAGTTLFRAAPGSRLADADAVIQQRTLESSNISVFEEMAELMTLTKNVEASQRILRSEDSAVRKLMQALG